MSDDFEVQVNATKTQIEDFISSILWQDIKRELEIWTGAFNTEMRGIVHGAEDSNPTTASILLRMGDLSGRIKATEYMLGIPEMFLELLDDKNSHGEEEDSEDGR